MQFGYTILYVEDVPKTIAFYEAAFGFARRFVHEAGDYGELDTGATALAFSSLRLMAELGKNPQRASADAPSFEIAFTTADVAAAVQRAVDAGARLVQVHRALLGPSPRMASLLAGLGVPTARHHSAA